jgi:6-phosphogluconolactonase
MTPSIPNATVSNATVRFAYVTNSASSDVSAYAINASSGVLTPVGGSPSFAARSAPQGVAIR